MKCHKNRATKIDFNGKSLLMFVVAKTDLKQSCGNFKVNLELDQRCREKELGDFENFHNSSSRTLNSFTFKRFCSRNFKKQRNLT